MTARPRSRSARRDSSPSAKKLRLEENTRVRDTFVGPPITVRAGVNFTKEVTHTFLIGTAQSLENRLGSGDLIRFDGLKKAANKTSSQIPDVGLTTVLVVPKESSRHNCQFRPDALGKSLLSEANGKQTVRVVLVPDDDGAIIPWILSAYRAFPLVSLKTNDKLTRSVDIQVHGAPSINTDLNHIGKYIRVTQALVDLPCSTLSTESYKAFIQEEIKDIPNVSLEAIEGEQLRDRGLGGVWNVGKGSPKDRQPKLIILSYLNDPSGSNAPAWILVGKGIVFDTGGLAIKGREGMCGMKRDMGGSAGVLGAFLAGARSKVKKNLRCVLALAENSVGENSFRQDDIFTMYSGKTVEINNTDAEGRLVLGDAVAYAAKHLNPHTIIDMATLTGAQGVATGKLHGAIVCNDEELQTRAVDLGKKVGEMVWPLPYCPELYMTEFKSEIADMKNSVACRANAQVSCAASFIHEHLPKNYEAKWLHIDMASPVAFGARATGYGVGLLSAIIGTL